MKNNTLITMAALFVALLATVPAAQALSLAQAKQVQHFALSVPLPEMPAQAAAIVTKADKSDRAEVAVLVVKAIVSKHKAAAPLVVAAIAKAAPEVAGVAAAAAVQVDRTQAVAVADAAGMAAPWASADIAALVTKAAPEKAAAIKPAAFRGFASVSASAFSFTTKKGAIVKPTASLTAELLQTAATSLGITVAQLEALADELPINFEFTGGTSVSVTIPLPLQPDGTISADTKAEIINTDGSLNTTKVAEVSKPVVAPTPVEIVYGAPRT